MTNRQAELRAWLVREGVAFKTLAQHLGISDSTASQVLRADVVRVAHLDGLRSFRSATGKSIPVNLLPEGRDRKPGPKPGWVERLRAEARAEAEAELRGASA